MAQFIFGAQRGEAVLSPSDVEARERALRLRLEVPELVFVFDLIRERALPQLRAGNNREFCSSSEFEQLLCEAASIRLQKTQYAKLCSALERCGIFSEAGVLHTDSLARLCQALQGHVAYEVAAKGQAISMQRILFTISQHWLDIVQGCEALQDSTAQVSEASFASCLLEGGVALSLSDVRAVWSTLLRRAGVECFAGGAQPSLSASQLHACFNKQDANGEDICSSLSAIMRDQPHQRLRKEHTLAGRSTAGAIFPAAPSSSLHLSHPAYLQTNLLPWCDTEASQTTNLKERLYCRIMELPPSTFSSFVQCIKTGSAVVGGGVTRSVLFQALLNIDVRVSKAEAEDVWRQATDSVCREGRRIGLTVEDLFAWLSKDVERRFLMERVVGPAIEVAEAPPRELTTPVEPLAAAVEEAGKTEGEVTAALETRNRSVQLQDSESPSLSRGSRDSAKSLLGLSETQSPLPHHRFKKSSGMTSSDSIAAVMGSSDTGCVFEAHVARSASFGPSETTASGAKGDSLDVRQRREVVAVCRKQRAQMALLFRNAAASLNTEGVTCKRVCEDLERYLQSCRAWSPPLSRAVVWRLVCDVAGVAYDLDSESACVQFLQLTQFLDRMGTLPSSVSASHARDHSQVDLLIKNKLHDCRDIKGQRLRLLSLSTILRQRLRTLRGHNAADDCSAADTAKLLESVNLHLSADELRHIMEQANMGEGGAGFAVETSAQLHRIVLCLSGYL